MKKTILTIFSFVFVLSISAQEKAIAKIHYQFKHVNDTTQRDKFIKDEVVLYLGESGTYYMSNASNRMAEQLSEQMSNASFDGNLKLKGSGSAIKDWYLFDFANSKMKKVRKIGSSEFTVKEDFPRQNWIIEEETKEIGGYDCQKATTTFKGRNYEAWFCTDIPLPYGPWKLNGLPGLILSAKDDKNEVVFEYAGFDKTESNQTVLIAASAQAVESTEEDIKRLDKAFLDNPNAFIKAQNASGGSVKVVSGFSATNTASVRPSQSGGTTFSVAQGVASSNMDPSRIKSISVDKVDDNKPSLVTNNPIELRK